MFKLFTAGDWKRTFTGLLNKAYYMFMRLFFSMVIRYSMKDINLLQ